MKKILIGLLLILGLVGSVQAADIYFWRYRSHATNCTSLTDGKATDMCYQVSDHKIYKCDPASGTTCTAPADWKELGGSGSFSGDLDDIAAGTTNIHLTTTLKSGYDTAYTDRLKWDGGSAGLTAATGRTSLGLGSAATAASTDFASSYTPTTANYGLFSPSGGAGTPTFRALVDSDIPNNITIDVSGSATTATFATSSGSATTATYAASSGSATTANYATTAGTAASSSTATTANYATTAGTASSSSTATTATYATSSGTASSSGTANTATYATSSGSATTSSYATNSGQLETHASSYFEPAISTGATTKFWRGDKTFVQVDLSKDVTGNIPVARFDSGTGANSTTFWRGDGAWASGAGGGTMTMIYPGAGVANSTGSAWGTSYGAVTTLGNPGADTNIPTEKAVRSAIGAAGGGTVSSVGMTVPTGFAVSGGPITGTGTLAVSYGTSTQNYFLAAPSGGNGTLAMRAIVAGDIPALAYAPSYTSITQSYGLFSPSGGAGTPTFRALVSGDIPNLSYAPSYSSTTANYLLAAPSGSAGTPTFRASTRLDYPLHRWHIDIVNPNAVVTASALIPIVNLTDAAITVTKVTASTSSASYEIAGDLKWADARIGLGNAAVIETFDTASGVRSDATIASPTVAAGKFVYLYYDSAPSTNMTDCVIDVDWNYS